MDGYKVKYVDPNKLFTVEFAIYSENLKSEVLIEQYSKCVIPFYITVILYIIKLMYYKLHILSYESFFFWHFSNKAISLNTTYSDSVKIACVEFAEMKKLISVLN